MKIRAGWPGSHLGPSIEYVRRIPEGLSLTPPFRNLPQLPFLRFITTVCVRGFSPQSPWMYFMDGPLLNWRKISLDILHMG